MKQKFISIMAIGLCIIQHAAAQQIPKEFGVTRSMNGGSDARPMSNSAIEFLIKRDSVWIGGGKGIDLTRDGGKSWKHFTNVSPFGEDDIAAIGSYGNTLWVSLAGSVRIDQTYLPDGKGLAYSTDNGASWKRVPQPMEPAKATVDTLLYGNNKIRTLAVTTSINNITYDLAVTNAAVWTASFAGGLRTSTDFGATWRRVVLPPDFRDTLRPTDSVDFDLSPVTRPDYKLRENLNHRVFSVMTTNDSTLWVGTAAGVNKSTDNGVSWSHFTFSNQANSISGNFVVALARSFYNGKDIIWAATNNALDSREYRAVSYSIDGGASWVTALRGEFCHNFGVKDSIVYAVSSNGIFRTDDGGKSWSSYTKFVDSKSHISLPDPGCYAVDAQADTVWVANSDGLMKTIESKDSFFGKDWTILRAYQDSPTQSDVYVYPSPFTPIEGVCRVHYNTGGGSKVTIKIFNFAMEPVRTLIRNAARNANAQYDEMWDGRDEDGRIAANGVYYVQVTVDDNASWAKVLVLQ